VAEGKALDIAQSAPIVSFSTRVAGATSLFEAASARVLVIADRTDNGEWQGAEGLALLERLNQIAPDRVVVCAGAQQRDLVERGARELSIPRERIVGSAPEALAAALKAFVALESNGSPQDVSLTVLGIPPGQTVVPWEDGTIGGLAIARVLSEPARRRLAARTLALWPPGPIAHAAAASAAIESILGRSRQRISAFVAPDDTFGRRARAAALPIYLGCEGIDRVESPALTVHDRVALENAMTL
jgi:malate dehydrogenase